MVLPSRELHCHTRPAAFRISLRHGDRRIRAASTTSFFFLCLYFWQCCKTRSWVLGWNGDGIFVFDLMIFYRDVTWQPLDLRRYTWCSPDGYIHIVFTIGPRLLHVSCLVFVHVLFVNMLWFVWQTICRNIYHAEAEMIHSHRAPHVGNAK